MATDPLKILAIDDNPDNLITLKAVVRDALPGAAVVTALSGPQGIALVLLEDPDVILLDIVMPGMDGYEVCRRLKADDRTRHIPVVFLTALRADREGRVRALEAGAEAFLARPLDEMELTAQIRAMAKIKAAVVQARQEHARLAARVVERTVELEQELAERVRTEVALRESEERYRTVLENIEDGYFEVDIAGNFTFFNESLCKILGYPRDEMLGMNNRQYMDKENARKVLQAFNRVYTTREPYVSFGWEIIRKDGERRSIESSTSLIRDSNGEQIGFRGIVRDITERKLAEEALRVLSERQEALLSAIPDIIMEVDSNKVYTWANRAGIEFFGEDVVGKEAAFYFEGEQDIYRAVQPLFNGSENVFYVESWQRRKDGEKRLLAWWCRVLKDDRGNVTGALSSARDITERVQAEAERAQLLAQIQAQAQQIAQIMDTVPEGVLLLDADGRVLLANPAGVRDLATLAGAAVDERLTHLGDLPLTELLAAADRAGPWHDIRAGRRIFEAIARPVAAGLAGDGPAAGPWVLVINDVTQARDLRDQLQQQERLAAVGQLAAGIAHDFNNILAIIALHAPMIARAPGLAERDRERLTIISEQTAHATRLIQQLLDFSRRAVLERRPLDLGPLLKEQVKLLARTLPEAIQVTLAYKPGEYVVLADPTRVQQMVMNLGVNARDAMPAGGTLRLTLAQQELAPRPDLPAGPWIRLEVADSGTGIAPEALGRLFEPFFTTKPRGQGTGLGLAQVYGIVKQHEGEIAVHSAPGQGATFTIYLPAVAAAAPVVTAPEAEPQEGAGETILIVEDNAALLEALSDVVEMLGYAVTGAGNGVEALAVLAARGADIALVLSDLVMPVMGGEALFEAIRARGLSVPVVILSGHPLEGELAGLKSKGLAGWLLKPPDLDQLARLLAQVLAGRRG